LRQLHLYGSGSFMPATRGDRRRVKTKRGLEKILAKTDGSKLRVVTTKKQEAGNRKRESDIGLLELGDLKGFNLSSP